MEIYLVSIDIPIPIQSTSISRFKFSFVIVSFKNDELKNKALINHSNYDNILLFDYSI